MFYDCTSLSSVTCLAEENVSNNSFQNTTNWLKGVSSSGTFTCPPNAFWTTGPHGIPGGWTKVDYVAP